MAHGDARKGKWRGNWRMEWVHGTFTLPQNMVYPAFLPLMRIPRLPVGDWTDTPADLNGLVRFAERRYVVSARVPSHFNWPSSGRSWFANANSYIIVTGTDHALSFGWFDIVINISRGVGVSPRSSCLFCVERDFAMGMPYIASRNTYQKNVVENFGIKRPLDGQSPWINIGYE